MDERVPKDKRLAFVWLEPDETGKLTHRFEQGAFFRLGATGCYGRREKGSTNAFKAKISVTEN